MDKETLSNYGWIVICVLVLAVMIALASPFGVFVSDAIKSTTQGLFDVNQNALNSTGLINIESQEFPACVHTYENFTCTQCGHVIEHICEYENYKCNACGKELPAPGKTAEEYTWDEIKTISDLGMGDEYFNLGDTKTIITTDSKTIVMKIVAFNTDIKSDGTGTAGITWISRDSIASRPMNSTHTSVGGWESSELRAWMQGEFYATLPENIRNSIVSVDKTYLDYNSGSPIDRTCTDNVWVPSARELWGAECANWGEKSGVEYTNYFTDYHARMSIGGDNYWYRTAAQYGNSDFRCALGSTFSGHNAHRALDVALCFCT